MMCAAGVAASPGPGPGLAAIDHGLAAIALQEVAATWVSAAATWARPPVMRVAMR
jgi:hypothetical protein